MDKLILYTSPSAFPNPQRVRLLMHEKGIAQHVEERVLDMAPGGEQRGWRHLKRNPWGETPTLELPDGGYLAESVAIARYLDLSFPGRKIMGEEPLEQAQDVMWNDRIWVQILYRLTTLFHVAHQGLGPKLELTSNPQWGEHCRKEALAHAGLVDRHLSDGRDWILGASSRPSPTSRCARQSPSQSSVRWRHRWTSATSRSSSSGSAGRHARASASLTRMAVASRN